MKSARSPTFARERFPVADIAWIDLALTSARPRAVAALLRYFHDLDTAEEAFQEARLSALKTWLGKALRATRRHGSSSLAATVASTRCAAGASKRRCPLKRPSPTWRTSRLA